MRAVVELMETAVRLLTGSGEPVRETDKKYMCNLLESYLAQTLGGQLVHL